MRIENGRIKECTEAELFIYWLNHWAQLIDFYSYKKACRELGTEIKTEDDET